MKKHFITFCSPGTFISETTTKEIEAWNIQLAKEMAKEIKERYGATPYGFYFTTRGRNEDELNSKIIASSGMYYLGGKIMTLEEVEAQNNPNNRTLIDNMKIGNHNKIIVNTNSWEFVAPLYEEDVVLPD